MQYSTFSYPLDAHIYQNVPKNHSDEISIVHQA